MHDTILSPSLRCLFAGGGAAGLALLSCAAQAQSPAPPGPLPRVDITGTLIPRATRETAAAVITLKRNDIERSGKTSVAELLQTLAVDNQGSLPSSFGGGFASGTSGISLRGVGRGALHLLANSFHPPFNHGVTTGAIHD